MPYALKTHLPNPQSPTHTLPAQKTMYNGKHIAEADTVYVFDSETQGGQGLIARATVTAAHPVPPTPGIPRQTPRVTLAITLIAHATRPLGRTQLRPLTAWHDGQPGTELNFKLYRQATNKIVAVSDEAAAFLDTFF